MMARKQDGPVRLFTRRGYDWTDRYPLIAKAVAALKAGSVTIDALKNRHTQAVAAAERARVAEWIRCAGSGRQHWQLPWPIPRPSSKRRPPQATLPAVVAGDPAGEMLAAWSDGLAPGWRVTATAIHRVRVAGLTIMPATAGLLLSFA